MTLTVTATHARLAITGAHARLAVTAAKTSLVPPAPVTPQTSGTFMIWSGLMPVYVNIEE